VTRPPFEVADIIREHGDRFIKTHGAWLTGQHRRVLRALARCRTAALGGHLDRCSRCDHRAISYNSCRNRHCPKCLTHARGQWLEARQDELLPVGYHHVVFTLPHQLSWLALQNKKVVYDLLFRASAATLLEVAADPKHLGATIGCLSVLHTWGQNLLHHPHVHCVIPVGGLSRDRAHWVHSRYRFFLPVKVLSRVFRGKFVAGLRRAFQLGRLSFPGRLQSLTDAPAFRAFLRRLFRHDWVVYAKPPFGGPAHVLQYLARYTHRVAISNHRILNVTDGTVTFQWKDYRHGSQQKTMTISAVEFLRRFFLHVLPKGFVRIRFLGFLAHRRRAHDLPLCRRALACRPSHVVTPPTVEPIAPSAAWPCPRCGGAMILIERLTACQIYGRAIAEGIFFDTS
jgi:Putative transposase/Transposase zinc-binding domain